MSNRTSMELKLSDYPLHVHCAFPVSMSNRTSMELKRIWRSEYLLKRDHYDARAFPKTRRILYRGRNPICLLGWVKITPLGKS